MYLYSCAYVLIFSHYIYGDTLRCKATNWPPNESDMIKERVINLNLPAEIRWREIMMEHKPVYLSIVNEIKNHFVKEYNIDSEYFSRFENNVVRSLKPAIPQEYQIEIKGIANTVGIHESYVIITSIVFDFLSLCTSVIQYDRIINDVIHIRNLDFGILHGLKEDQVLHILKTMLQPLMISVNFTFNGEVMYRSIHYAGSIGSLTGVSIGRFAVSMNVRNAIEGSFVGLMELLKSKKINQSFASIMVRETLSNHLLDYDKAIKYAL
ncbi:hypothetical protein GJ496_001272 [Pomphorhynchus laevis]|nr:hypothetical protein GJ496_001272 [Pomphorhynchus laevis]